MADEIETTTPDPASGKVLRTRRDFDAFGASHRAQLVRRARLLGAGQEDAEQVVQDTLLDTWRRRRMFASLEHACRTMFVMLRNKVADLFRRQRLVLDERACERAVAVDREDELRLLAFTMDYRSQLSEGRPLTRREAFDAGHEDDEKQKAVAASLGVPYSTFKTRVQNERKKFLVALVEYLTLVVAWLKRRVLAITAAAAAAIIAWLLFVPPKPTCNAATKTGDGYAYQRFVGQCGIGQEATSSALDLKFVDAGPVPGLYLISDGEVIVGYVRRQRGTDINDPTVQVTPGSYAAVANHTGQDVILCVGKSASECRTLRNGESATAGKWPMKWFRTSRSFEKNLLDSASKPMPLVYESGGSQQDVALSAGDHPFPADWQKQLASGRPGKYRVRLGDRGATIAFTLPSPTETAGCEICGQGTACISVSGSGLIECATSPKLLMLKSQTHPSKANSVADKDRAGVYGR